MPAALGHDRPPTRRAGPAWRWPKSNSTRTPADVAGAAAAGLRRLLGAGHAYFQDRGRRAAGLEMAVTDIDHLGVDLS
ncbi:hypothetical protein ACXZ65_37170 [Streptomyces aculeolatus]